MKVSSAATPDFSKENLVGKPVEFAPGAWVCGERHKAGGIGNINVNNRTFIFKLTLRESLGGVPAGSDCLFIYGAGNSGAIKGVKDLEVSTGLKAVALLNNGGSHHILLDKWYEDFPEMTIWVTPTKIPRTYNGEQLRKKYADRWELANNTTVPHHVYQLLRYFGDSGDLQVDCVVFNQLMGASDESSAKVGSWNSPEDEPELKPTSFLVGFGALASECKEPSDDVVFFHKASEMIITGHHFQFIYVPKDYKMPKELKTEGSFVWRHIVPLQLHKKGKYDTMLGTGVKRVRDYKVHASQWKEVLKWEFKYSCSHHDPVGVCGPIGDPKVMKGDGGLKGYITRVLEKSGELSGDPSKSGVLFLGSSNAVCKCQSQESKYVKKYGDMPVLPLGGPGYDECGYTIEQNA